MINSQYLNLVSEKLESHFYEKECFLQQKLTSSALQSYLSKIIKWMQILLFIFFGSLVFLAILKSFIDSQNIFLDLLSVIIIILFMLTIMVYEIVLILKEVTTYRDTLKRIKADTSKKIELGQLILINSVNVSKSKKFTLSIYIKEFKNEINSIEGNIRNLNFYLFFLCTFILIVLVFSNFDLLQVIDFIEKEILNVSKASNDIFEFIKIISEKVIAKFGIPFLILQLILGPLLQISASKQIQRHQECIHLLECLLGYVE